MTVGRLRRPLDVSIPIGSLNFPTISFSDISDGSFPGGDRKGSIGLGCHPTYMYPWIVQVVGDTGRHDISCAETMREVLGLRLGSGKTQGIHQTHLAAPMPICRDEQGNNPLDLQGFGSADSYAGRVMPMRLF
jgi:hypothetical protein